MKILVTGNSSFIGVKLVKALIGNNHSVFQIDSNNEPRDFYKINCMGTRNILELCRKNNAKMVFMSSYIYGVLEYLPIDEGHTVNPSNPYAQAKVIGENICRYYSQDFGVPVFIIRSFNIYCPGQKQRYLITKMIDSTLKDTIRINDLRPKRDFIFIDDTIRFF